MKKLLTTLFLLCALAAAPMTYGATAMVTGVEFLPGKTVTIKMAPQEIAPQVKMWADVQFKHGQSRIKLKYHDMKPAILFGGDVTSYVLWALTADGRATNLGEVQARKTADTEIFYVGLKGFALVMTAEPYYMVARPSEMVMFIGGPPEKERSRSKTYAYTEFSRAPRHAERSIANVKWEPGEMNLGLLQARKAFELAGRFKAGNYAREAFNMAASELNAAEEIAKDKPKSSKIDNPARNCVQLSNTAINIANRTQASNAFKDMLRQHQATLAAANERSETAEYLAAALANQTVHLKTTLREVEEENLELQAFLEDPLSNIATTRIEAAKIVLTLPGIVFDTDKATLKPDAQMALAKLSGILMVFHRATVAIGGYTDSTGAAEYNQTLSQKRADAVRTLLVEEGVAEGRLTARGFGNASPVADNSSDEGRAQNRRVELVIIAGRG
jgi:outer membrane protein OmpA-like peptidoglycan-associated protein